MAQHPENDPSRVDEQHISTSKKFLKSGHLEPGSKINILPHLPMEAELRRMTAFFIHFVQMTMGSLISVYIYII